MQHPKDLTDRELLQTVLAFQVDVLSKLNRVEAAIADMYSDMGREHTYHDLGKQSDETYSEALLLKDELFIQLDKKSGDNK